MLLELLEGFFEGEKVRSMGGGIAFCGTQQYHPAILTPSFFVLEAAKA